MGIRYRGRSQVLCFIAASLCMSAWLPTNSALANPEPPGLYDARSVAMAGTGVAYLDSAAAIFHNPAALEQIERVSFTLATTVLMVDFSAPFAGPGTEQSSGLQIAPLGFLGMAYRLSDEVVAGAGIYISTGFGGGFTDVSAIGVPGSELILDPPEDQSVFLYVGELSLPLGFRVSESLRLGMSLRIPYASQEVATHQEVGTDSWQPVQQSIAGFGNPGLLLGALYQASPNLRLGFAYRSKVSIPMTGTTSVALVGDEPSNFDTRTSWNVPHMFRIGAAWNTLDERFLVSAEFRAQFHREANDEQAFEILSDSGRPLLTLTAPFKWRNVYGGLIGAEYWLTQYMPVRLGFSIARAATPDETVTTFTPPPGVQTALYAGLGLNTESLRIDVGGAYASADHTIAESAEGCVAGAQVKVGCAGTYGVDTFFVGVSFSYQPTEEL